MDITCTYCSHYFKDTYIATFIHILAIYSYVHVYVCVYVCVCMCVCSAGGGKLMVSTWAS